MTQYGYNHMVFESDWLVQRILRVPSNQERLPAVETGNRNGGE